MQQYSFKKHINLSHNHRPAAL